MIKQLFKHCLLTASMILTLSAGAQNENSKWYFGGQVGLDFMTNPPTILYNGALSTMEGCSTISDGAGNLLFYTNGIDVWNSQHTIMSNGTGLNGGTSTTQSALIVKKPGSSTLYYIFTMGVSYPNYGGPLNYSIVDMSQAGGLGSVITKNVYMDSICTEKLAAARHCNGTDAWIIMHSNHSNAFKAFLLTGAGVSLNPVISQVGTVHNSGAIGYLKVSPNGQKLGLAVNLSGFELYDFDKATGVVSNPVMLGGLPQSPYGCEFSPDGSKFYGCNSLQQNNPIHQWDLCAGSAQAIAASHTIVGNGTGVLEVGSFQLGMDGKIYVSRYGASTIAIINNPNVYGPGCNFVNLAMNLAPKTCYYAFQNFINDFAGPAPAVCYGYDCSSVATSLASQAEESVRAALYPNPAAKNLFLETEANLQLVIINQLGAIVFEGAFKTGRHTIDLTGFETGIYTAKLLSNTGVRTMRIVKAE